MPLLFKDDRQMTRIADFILSSSVVGDYLNRKTVERFQEYDTLYVSQLRQLVLRIGQK